MNGFKPPRFFRCPDLNCQYLDRGGQSPRTPGRTLLQITHVVDADDVLRRIPYRLVSGDVGFAENVRLTVKGFALTDDWMALPFGSKTVPTALEPSSFFM